MKVKDLTDEELMKFLLEKKRQALSAISLSSSDQDVKDEIEKATIVDEVDFLRGRVNQHPTEQTIDGLAKGGNLYLLVRVRFDNVENVNLTSIQRSRIKAVTTKWYKKGFTETSNLGITLFLTKDFN